MPKPISHSNPRALLLAIVAGLVACTRQDHLELESPWFPLDGERIGLQVTSSGWLEAEGRRISHREISEKALDMIAGAEHFIVASIFLFDNFYSEEPASWDVVAAFTEALLTQKSRHPDLVAALVLDPSNRAYSNRIAPAVARLSEAGVDIFYSDLLATPAHTPIKLVEAIHHGSRALSQATGGWLGRAFKPLLSAIPIPFVGEFDEHPANLQMALTAALVKANHRKLIVTDRGDSHEALISSANPHNASVNSTNFSLSITGTLARYIYNAQRQDIVHSISLKDRDYILWHRGASKQYRQTYLDKVLPSLPVDAPPVDQQALINSDRARARFVTERRIKDDLLATLAEVQTGDEVRIQMFYLSDFDVVNALMRAATITKAPIKMLLDPSKDAFGRLKDGTPNRQVAALLTGNLDGASMRKLRRHFPDYINGETLTDLNIELRWFDTHGEQNHAKIMSITNLSAGKFDVLHGSANWTGKNLSGINMEANIHVAGSPKLVTRFNSIFDSFFYNVPIWLQADFDHDRANHYPLSTPDPAEHALIYSVPYDHQEYSEHSGITKWINGEKYGFVSW